MDCASGREATPRRKASAWLAGCTAVVLAVIGLTVAAHHPLSPSFTVLVFASIAVTGFLWTAPIALIAVPALLPLLAFAPWTGWIAIEEFDLLVLAVCAGGYARLAASPSEHRSRTTPLTAVLILLFAASLLLSAVRGIDDAGGFHFGWYQGYREPMNSVRLAKGFFLAALMLPLWSAAHRASPMRATLLLLTGLTLGLIGASVAALWERLAFTGLLNFSTVYRTTALFWEMHVGGASLDGFLALSIPPALVALYRADTPALRATAGAALLVASYAALTTFSRGVYLAVPVGAAATLCLLWRQQRVSERSPPGKALWRGLALAGAFTIGAAWLFPLSGHRGTLALLGAAGLMLPLMQTVRGLRRAQFMGAAVIGALAIALCAAIAWLAPKGAYVAYACAFVLTSAAIVVSRKGYAAGGAYALGGFVAVVGCIGMVALHWGGPEALQRSAVVITAVLLLLALGARLATPPWPARLSWQVSVFGVLLALGLSVGVSGGGALIGDRFSTARQDFEFRASHWLRSARMLESRAQWWLGKGLGRFPDHFVMADIAANNPGDHRIRTEAGNTYLVQANGMRPNGWLDVLRVTQRVSRIDGRSTVKGRIRTSERVQLQFELCEKHLLFSEACQRAVVRLDARAGQWQPFDTALQGKLLPGGTWYAPRFVAFTIAVETRGGVVDLDDLDLVDGAGAQHLSNGDFSNGMARWFFTNDGYHLPWHIENLAFSVLFDQGMLGLALFTALTVGALWRLTLGSAKAHPLAPSLAGALVGFAILGTLNTLLDAARIAFLYYFVLLVALTLRAPRMERPPPSPPREREAGSLRGPSGAALGLVAAVALMLAPLPAEAQIAPPASQSIQVGPQRAVATISEAARLARPGSTIEVDAGTYRGDTAVWTRDDITIRAVGGRVRLLANGAAAEGKGIWVVRAEGITVEGFDFEGARVPSRNGAGIRFDRGSLTVRDCRFIDNEMGLLTGNEPRTVLTVENSEFAYNHRPDGHNHNLYAGTIARLTVRGSYFHDAHVGHLLKSRAAVSVIEYNRLTDEGGRASYELEFPNGGVAYVVGNVIQQSARTENEQIISFGAEGYRWPTNELYFAHNTVIDDLPQGGVFLHTNPGVNHVVAVNNLWVGAGRLPADSAAALHNNFTVDRSVFAAEHGGDFRLKPTSPVWERAVDPGKANGVSLMPRREYRHPRTSVVLSGRAMQPGAMQSPAPADR